MDDIRRIRFVYPPIIFLVLLAAAFGTDPDFDYEKFVVDAKKEFRSCQPAWTRLLVL